MRLIDPDKLYEDLANNLSSIMGDGSDGEAIDTYVTIGDIIHDTFNAHPTAYDPDKVVEQLEERTAFLKDCTKYGNKTADQQSKSYDTMMMYEVMDLVDDLLEIVKAGVSDGN